MKKILALLFVFLMIVSTLSLVACTVTPDPGTEQPGTNDQPGEDEENNDQPEEEVKLEPNLPEVTFDNEDFVFYHWGGDSDWIYWNDIWVENYTGDTIDNAVFARNSYVEEKYQINITLLMDDYVTYFENVRQAVEVGEDRYDVVVSMGHCIPHMYTGNVFYNLYEVPNLDLDQPWWSQTAIEDLTLNGYLPFTVSDLTVLDKGATSAVFFNKGLAEDYELGNLYELVEENNWTLETMIDLGESVAHDTGNDEIDDQDVYGIVCGDDPVEMLFHGFGMSYVSSDDAGYPYCSFADEGNFEKIQYYLENVMFNEALLYNREWYPDSTSYMNMFTADKGLFMFKELNAVRTLSQMQTDYGILPIPKWDEEQERYYSSASVFGGNLLSVPISNTEIETAGVILEALSAESKYTVIPAFYDVVLKGRATRDEESVKMLDIIIDTMTFDVGNFYNLGGFSDDFLRITGNANANGHGTPARSSDVASFWAEREDVVAEALDTLIDIIEEWKALGDKE